MGYYVYLEEDCDANIYLKTLEKNNVPYEIKDSHTDKKSHIRNYMIFTVGSLNYYHKGEDITYKTIGGETIRTRAIINRKKWVNPSHKAVLAMMAKDRREKINRMKK
jgi:hypothetical protein